VNIKLFQFDLYFIFNANLSVYRENSRPFKSVIPSNKLRYGYSPPLLGVDVFPWTWKIHSPSFPIFRVGRAFERGNLELHHFFRFSLHHVASLSRLREPLTSRLSTWNLEATSIPIPRGRINARICHSYYRCDVQYTNDT